MYLHSISPQISNRSSMSNVEDLVGCFERWVQMECRRILCMDSGPCATVNNRPRFFLISRIRRALLQRRKGGGFIILFIPAPVHRRCISGIEWNTRYELIWVVVLRDSRALTTLMTARYGMKSISFLLSPRAELTSRPQPKKAISRSTQHPHAIQKKVTNKFGRAGTLRCRHCVRLKKRVHAA
jgi:hypothetical protein